MEPKIIHVGKIFSSHQSYVLLKKLEPFRYVWFLKNHQNQEDAQTEIWGGTPEEAIQAGRRFWKHHEFNLLHCGFRYTLPERDEIGTNALFHQMLASYESMTGVYFDEELGSNCIVNLASQEARDFAKSLQVSPLTRL
ncbi:MAG: hypothetical protein Q8K60_02680 [Parachlamydiaceae bacterium]|nr:hypothetical protein [Parachlamydiaceae bacterium]